MSACRKRERQRGAEIVEASFVFLAFIGLLFLLMDLSWAVFAKASIQHGVREGCRYAMTSRTSGALGQIESIKKSVQSNAMGFLAESGDYSKIVVRFYKPDTQVEVSGAGSNSGGNLVIVSVENYAVKPMFPLFRPSTPVTFTVRAGDKLEASPGGIPPAL